MKKTFSLFPASRLVAAHTKTLPHPPPYHHQGSSVLSTIRAIFFRFSLGQEGGRARAREKRWGGPTSSPGSQSGASPRPTFSTSHTRHLDTTSSHHLPFTIRARGGRGSDGRESGRAVGGMNTTRAGLARKESFSSWRRFRPCHVCAAYAATKTGQGHNH